MTAPWPGVSRRNLSRRLSAGLARARARAAQVYRACTGTARSSFKFESCQRVRASHPPIPLCRRDRDSRRCRCRALKLEQTALSGGFAQPYSVRCRRAREASPMNARKSESLRGTRRRRALLRGCALRLLTVRVHSTTCAQDCGNRRHSAGRFQSSLQDAIDRASCQLVSTC